MHSAVEDAKQVTRIVGWSLASLVGQELREEEIEPLLASLKALEQAASLHEDAIRAAAGTT